MERFFRQTPWSIFAFEEKAFASQADRQGCVPSALPSSEEGALKHNLVAAFSEGCQKPSPACTS